MPATDAPPSYDSIVGKVNTAILADSSYKGLQATLTSLTQAEKDTVAAKAEPLQLNLNPVQQGKFLAGFAKGLQSAQAELDWNAQECARLCKKVDEDFSALANKLSSISALDGGQDSKALLTEFVELQVRYQDLLTSSRVSAVKIPGQASDFDLLIVPLVYDSTIPLAEKKELINGYITDAKGLKAEADKYHQDFLTFAGDINIFVGKFKAWAVTKERQLGGEIKRLEDDIASLKAEVGRLSVGAVTGFALPAFIAGAACAGPVAAPIIAAIGIFFAIGSVATMIALAIKMESLNNQITAKTNEKKVLEKQLSDIQNSRTELVALGAVVNSDVAAAIGIINSVWGYLEDDATNIIQCLERGETPAYMAAKLGEADGIYTVVSQYLRKYADCLADTSKSGNK